MKIAQQRISHQLLGEHPFKNPVEVVRHMLCMQAQDFKQMKRAIGSRCGCSQEDIEDAFKSGQLVRTRTQRWTLHVVASEDAGWMTKLCASKTLGGFQKRRDLLGIEDHEMEDILGTLPNILDHGPLSRSDIAQALQSKGFDITANKPYHIMCYAGTLGLTVQGPILDGEHCFVLSSQWIKNPKILSEDESLAELCMRYFSSHGPATIADLQWWSGLGVGVLRKGVELCGDGLHEKDGYYLPSPLTPLPSRGTEVPIASLGEGKLHFLAGFDEFLLGYKDRTATLDLDHHTLVDKARNGVFKPTLMIDGKTVATWSVKQKTKSCEVIISPFEDIEIPSDILEKQLEQYQKFVGKECKVTI